MEGKLVKFTEGTNGNPQDSSVRHVVFLHLLLEIPSNEDAVNRCSNPEQVIQEVSLVCILCSLVVMRSRC